MCLDQRGLTFHPHFHIRFLFSAEGVRAERGVQHCRGRSQVRDGPDPDPPGCGAQPRGDEQRVVRQHRTGTPDGAATVAAE